MPATNKTVFKIAFRHDLVSAWNHTEDMVDVSPLTTNVYRTYHETFRTGGGGR